MVVAPVLTEVPPVGRVLDGVVAAGPQPRLTIIPNTNSRASNFFTRTVLSTVMGVRMQRTLASVAKAGKSSLAGRQTRPAVTGRLPGLRPQPTATKEPKIMDWEGLLPSWFP